MDTMIYTDLLNDEVEQASEYMQDIVASLPSITSLVIPEQPIASVATHATKHTTSRWSQNSNNVLPKLLNNDDVKVHDAPSDLDIGSLIVPDWPHVVMTDVSSEQLSYEGELSNDEMYMSEHVATQREDVAKKNKHFAQNGKNEKGNGKNEKGNGKNEKGNGKNENGKNENGKNENGKNENGKNENGKNENGKNENTTQWSGINKVLFFDTGNSHRQFFDSLTRVFAPVPPNARDRSLITELFVPLTCSYVFTRDLKLAGFTNTNEHDFIPLYRLAEQRLRGSLTKQARCDLLIQISKNSLGQKLIQYSPLTIIGTQYIVNAPMSTGACQILADLRDMGSGMTPSHVGSLLVMTPLTSAQSSLVELVTSSAFAPFIQLLFAESPLTFALVSQALARCFEYIYRGNESKSTNIIT